MKVMLARDWFLDGTLYEKRAYPVEIPDDLAPRLPQGAVIVDKVAPVPKDEPQVLTTLADFDAERHEGDLETAFKKHKPRAK